MISFNTLVTPDTSGQEGSEQKMDAADGGEEEEEESETFCHVCNIECNTTNVS